MKRVFISLLLFLVAASGVLAYSPPVVNVSSDSAGVTYRLEGAAPMPKAALAAWFGESKWEDITIRINVDAATSFCAIAELLTLLKEVGGIERFEIVTTAETKVEPRELVSYTLGVANGQIGPARRQLLPPPEASPKAVIQSIKPWTPAPPKLSPPTKK